MIVSKEKKFICVPTPKCASRSISHMLYYSNSKVLLGKHHQRAVEDKMKYPSLDGFYIEQSKSFCESLEDFKSYYKFTFVRNPYSRLVSCWKNKMDKDKKYDIDTISGKYAFKKFNHLRGLSFEEFIEYITSSEKKLKEDKHWAPFYHIIPLWKIDYTGRVESFQKDISYIFKKLSIKTEKSFFIKEGENQTEHDHFSKYYNKKTKNLVAEAYEADFTRYNYKQ